VIQTKEVEDVAVSSFCPMARALDHLILTWRRVLIECIAALSLVIGDVRRGV